MLVSSHATANLPMHAAYAAWPLIMMAGILQWCYSIAKYTSQTMVCKTAVLSTSTVLRTQHHVNTSNDRTRLESTPLVVLQPAATPSLNQYPPLVARTGLMSSARHIRTDSKLSISQHAAFKAPSRVPSERATACRIQVLQSQLHMSTVTDGHPGCS